jgi:hypothetical protein
MQEFILTLVVFFVLFRVLGEVRGNRGPVKIFYFNQRPDANQRNQKQETTVNTNSSKKKISKDDDGDYVDYEEIKD